MQSSALFLFGKFIHPKLGDVYIVVISCLSVMAYFIVFPLITEVWLSFAGESFLNLVAMRVKLFCLY